MKSCNKIANKMGKINESDIPFIIKHGYVKEQFDKELITDIGKMFMQPSRVNIFMASKAFERDCIINEIWMLTKFTLEDIQADLLKAME